jgi:hypothetical protein
MNDIKPRTAFIPNYPEEIVPLLSLLIIQVSLTVMSSGIELPDLLDLTTLRPSLGLTKDDQIYPLFATDTDAMYEILNLMLTKQMPPLLDPLNFYSVMVYGSIDGESFWENHIYRNPEGLKFVFLMLKRINLQGLMRNDTKSIELHSSLKDCLIEIESRGLLHFNPAPFIRQLDLYLQM